MRLPRRISIPIALAAVTVAVAADSAAAAEWFILTYEPPVAVGQTRDFVGQPGYLGFGAEMRSFRGKRLAWSLSGHWHNMYEKSREVIQLGNTTVSGTQVRYLDFVPILLGVDYHFLSRNYRVRPYAGVGGGVCWVSQRVELGTVQVDVNKGWYPAVAPEVGVTFTTPDLEFYGFVASSFDYVFGREGSTDYSYVTLKLGFVYIL